jgi:hypothetical protein
MFDIPDEIALWGAGWMLRSHILLFTTGDRLQGADE